MSKKPHKPAPTPRDPLAKLVAEVKRFMTTLPKHYVYIAVAAVVVVGGATVVLQPKRTEAKFCSTLNEGMSGIESRYQDASGTGTMNVMGTWAGNISEFSKLLRDLNEVAPPEIENDMKAVHDSWNQSMDDGAKNGATAVTNPLGALASGLGSGLANAVKNGASYKAVDDYSKTHCGRGLFSGSTSQNSQDQTTSEQSFPSTIALDSVENTDFKPWESTQKGLVIKTYDGLTLVDTNTWTATAKLRLPESKGRTPGGDSGRSYTIDMTKDGYDSTMFGSFSPDMRYIIATYDTPKAEVAYYDLKEQKLIGIDMAPAEHGLLHNSRGGVAFTKTGLLYLDNTYDKKETKTYYDIATKKTMTGEPHFASDAGGKYDVVVYNYATKKDTTIYTGYDGELPGIEYNGELDDAGYFSPCYGSNFIGLINDNTLLCKADKGIKAIDITNLVNKRAEKDNPDRHDYVVGRLRYRVKDAFVVDIGGKASSYALSPDLKKIALLRNESDTTSLYVADLSTGESTKIADVTHETASDFSLLKWQ